MVDGVGVCTICARVCHAGHDVTYSKHGSFFCDCGAKEDGSCIALVKRTSSAMVQISVDLPIRFSPLVANGSVLEYLLNNEQHLDVRNIVKLCQF
jgi:hypothetical protein